MTLGSLGVEEKYLPLDCVRLLVAACVSNAGALDRFLSMPDLDPWLMDVLLQVGASPSLSLSPSLSV